MSYNFANVLKTYLQTFIVPKQYLFYSQAPIFISELFATDHFIDQFYHFLIIGRFFLKDYFFLTLFDFQESLLTESVNYFCLTAEEKWYGQG